MVTVMASRNDVGTAQGNPSLSIEAHQLALSATLKTDDQSHNGPNYLSGQTGVLLENEIHSTPGHAGHKDEYLSGQTGVRLENEHHSAPGDAEHKDAYLSGQTGVLPETANQEDLPTHLRDYRYGQTGVLGTDRSDL